MKVSTNASMKRFDQRSNPEGRIVEYFKRPNSEFDRFLTVLSRSGQRRLIDRTEACRRFFLSFPECGSNHLFYSSCLAPSYLFKLVQDSARY